MRQKIQPKPEKSAIFSKKKICNFFPNTLFFCYFFAKNLILFDVSVGSSIALENFLIVSNI